MRRNRYRAALAALVVAGAVLRVLAARGELWLDEVWSFERARGLTGLWQVFSLHHDNNHHLNTLWLALWEPTAPALLLRLPAVLAGTASVWLAALCLEPRGRAAALWGAGLVASNGLLVLLGSEARGYGLAVCLGLLALVALQRFLARGGAGAAALFVLAAVLGPLAHLSVLYLLAACGVWAAWVLLRRGSPLCALGGLAGLFLLPAASFALLYAVDLRHLAVGGGDATDRLAVLHSAASMVLGGPARSVPYAALGALLLLAAGARLVVRRDARALLYGCGIALVPGALILWWQPEVMYLRYWTVPLCLALLLLGEGLAALWRKGGAARLIALAAALLALVGNGLYGAGLWQHGRGSYTPALEIILAESVGPEIRVAADHTFRTGVLVDFHQLRLERGGKRLKVVGGRDARGVRWLLLHSHDPEARPPPEATEAGMRFRWRASYPFARDSGCHWWLYARVQRGG